MIGRAEDMHAILDAERDATLAYLDGMVQHEGGRRGRAAGIDATGGLIYAHTRHATSRAGDPCPHDHVLIANVVEMRDERGGWKALDTVAVRDHLHAATMVGRLAGGPEGGRARLRHRPGSRTVGPARALGHRRHPARGPGAALQAVGRHRRLPRPHRASRAGGRGGSRRARRGSTSATRRSASCCPTGGTSWPAGPGPGAPGRVGRAAAASNE